MRYLVLLLLLNFTSAFAQTTPGKFVSAEEQISVFLEETPEGLIASLTPGYGVFNSFEVRREGNELSGTLEDGTHVTVVLEGDTLRLTPDGDETQVLVLTRQQADVPLADKTPLLSMLELVPDTVTARQGVPSVSFVDFGAALERSPVSPHAPQTSADFAAMSPEAQRTWLKTLQNLRGGPPDLLPFLPMMIENMPDLLGFDWFDIGRALSYGTPPNVATLLAAAPDPDRLAEKLLERDFERTSYQGTTLWQKGEEGSIDIMSREPGDPFVGSLGKAVRLAVFPDFLADTSSTAMTQAIIDSHDDRYPSLADADDYRTLAEALALEEGALVQAQFWNLFDVGFVPRDPFTGMVEPPTTPFDPPETAPQGDPLPLYGLAVLADSQVGPEQVGTLALLYEDGETAQQAAAVLTARLEAARRAEDEESGVTYEAWGVRVEDGRVFESSTGLWAAVASVRYPLPTAEDAPAPGAVFAGWIDEIARREFGLLEVDPALTP